MNSQIVKLFQDQLSRYYEIAKVERLDSGLQALPTAALSFAERLSLSPTENAAKRQMRQDPAAARAFLQIATSLDGEFLEHVTPASDTDIIGNGPFFVVASGVQEYLKFLRDHKQ